MKYIILWCIKFEEEATGLFLKVGEPDGRAIIERCTPFSFLSFGTTAAT